MNLKIILILLIPFRITNIKKHFRTSCVDRRIRRIYIHRSFIPQCLVVQVFTVSEISFVHGKFVSGLRTDEQKIKKIRLEALSFSIIPENLRKIYPVIFEKNSAEKKRGGGIRKKNTTITFCLKRTTFII